MSTQRRLAYWSDETVEHSENSDKVSDAATRVRAWLNELKTMKGMDQEVLHQANGKELRASDLTLVLDALGQDR